MANETKQKFPKQNSEGEKIAHKNSDKDEEYIDDNRGGTALDLNYDGPETENEAPESFKKRSDKSLKGDPTMGNDQGKDVANVVKDEVGDDLIKKAKAKKVAKKKEPMYKKDQQPVKTVNEEQSVNPLITEEIQKMKNLVSYNEKTQ